MHICCFVMAILLESKSIVFQILTLYLLVDNSSGKIFPAVFTFGDSLVDVGNNYYIETIAKPTLPNGIDFGTEQELGFGSFSPPYLSPMAAGDIILMGVNYASAASGILSDTGNIYGGHIGLEAQITNFGNTKQDIMNRIDTAAAESLLRESLYIIAIGANDVMTGLVTTLTNSSREAYFDKLISTFRSQLIRLYFLGARKIVVMNCACIGNIPVRRAIFPNDFIVPLNQVVQYYNSRLKKLLTELTTSLTGSMYVYSDVYASLQNILQNGKTYGKYNCFENVDSACCHGIGPFDGIFSCKTGFQVCKNRSKYMFWDQFHPTDAAYLIMAKHFMDGGLNYISPMNIRQLMNFPVN
ncbi:hypothetical protein Ddye_019923 [Dipteronia dyeriana]|uniref:GDSL esterase/lipase n=1 Tax=Dipteronia dyeriana TaxID=168575 RepID=A0AAD9TZ97_9ROSI|nr:hypothetical protein Ddye_019923 [Dipteronia dyeriana]